MCARPGTYVVDLIGNGMSSRAVVHKGRLRHVMRVGAAGHVVTIVDEQRGSRPRPDARAWIGDREYVPDDARRVRRAVLDRRPARTPMLLAAGDVATVAYLELAPRSTSSTLDLALDRQSADRRAGPRARSPASR